MMRHLINSEPSDPLNRTSPNGRLFFLWFLNSIKSKERFINTLLENFSCSLLVADALLGAALRTETRRCICSDTSGHW